MYAIVKDNEVVEWPIHSIHTRFPQTSFPQTITTQSLPDGVVKVLPPVEPEYDDATHKLEITPPQYVEGVWKQVYNVVELSPEETQEQADIKQKSLDGQRLQAYRTESDPLFFKAQRGEATQQEWLDKVAEIKARYPA